MGANTGMSFVVVVYIGMNYMATTYAVTAHLGIAYIVTAPCSYALYSYGLWPG